MGERLAACFDRAVDASLREKDSDGIRSELVSYLTDAHAIEAQALQLLRAQPNTPAKLAGFAFAFEHLEIAAYELLRRVAIAAVTNAWEVTFIDLSRLRVLAVAPHPGSSVRS